MRDYIKVIVLCAVLAMPAAVQADVLNYNEVTELNKQSGNTLPVFEIGDGAGKTVYMVERSDHFYINVKAVNVYSSPGNLSNLVGILSNGMEVERTAVCNNGWSRVYWIDAGTKFFGYIPDSVLCEKYEIKSVSEQKIIVQDVEILDYPSWKDGEVCGEVRASQEVTRIEEIDSNWSKISYTAENGETVEGYILNTMFETEKDELQNTDELQEEVELPEDITNVQKEEVELSEDITDVQKEESEIPEDIIDVQQEVETNTTIGTDETVENAKENESDEISLDNEGSIHKSEGSGLFAEAVEAVPEVKTSEAGVQIGTPIAVSSDASLVPLGKFRITHYCPCSICCGPWANGITSTGVTATTNHTIAVNPSQIPYGSKVVVNGQVYVAEDCGGGITDNCIDIYVATHEEGEAKGMFYTDVYLLQE